MNPSIRELEPETTLPRSMAARELVGPVAERLRGRIPELDGVRGLAILLVLSLHYVSDIAHVSWGYLFRLGWSGVDLFFVLSGFLIGGILLDARGSECYFRTFYLRRFFRIVPVYAVLLLGLLIGLWCVGPAAPKPLAKIFNTSLPLWTYPLFVQNIAISVRHSVVEWTGVTWSLAVEEQFYLILPFLVYRLRAKSIGRLSVCMILLAPMLRILFQRYLDVNGIAFYMLLPCRADALSCGVLVALACRDRNVWDWVGSHQRYFVALLALLAFGAGLWTFFTVPIMAWIGYSWMAALYTTLLLLVLVNPAPFRFVFRNPLLVKLGTIAYGVYLFHVGTLNLCHYLFFRASPSVHSLPTLGVTALSLATVILICAISWRFLEKPLIGHARSKYRY